MSADTLLDDLITLAAESETIKKKKRNERSTLGPKLDLEFRQEYNWVLHDDVKLLVERVTCTGCGKTYETPWGVMLHYTAFHRVRGQLSEARKWKRAEPSDGFPTNPNFLSETTDRQVPTCQNCWGTVRPATVAPEVLEEIFKDFQTPTPTTEVQDAAQAA